MINVDTITPGVVLGLVGRRTRHYLHVVWCPSYVERDRADYAYDDHYYKSPVWRVLVYKDWCYNDGTAERIDRRVDQTARSLRMLGLVRVVLDEDKDYALEVTDRGRELIERHAFDVQAALIFEDVLD